MVIVKILGGLASQLQQYIIGYLLAKDRNTDLYLDLSQYLNGYFRPFVLSALTLPDAKIVRDNEIIKKASAVNNGPELLDIYKKEKFPDVYICSEAENYRAFFDAYPNLYPKADLELFKTIRLKEKSSFLDDFSKHISDKYSIGVHVRLGDFRTIDWTDNMDRYKAAIGLELSRHPEGHIYFFSNDIEETEHIFGKDERYTYVHHTNGYIGDIEEFFAFAMCRGKIISTRSGYSRYAVYMGLNSFESDRAIYLDKLDILKDGCDILTDEQFEEGLVYYKRKHPDADEYCMNEENEKTESEDPDMNPEGYEILGDDPRAEHELRYDTALYDCSAFSEQLLNEFWNKHYRKTDSLIVSGQSKLTAMLNNAYGKGAYVIIDPEAYNRWYKRKYFTLAEILSRLGNWVLYINSNTRDNFKMPMNELTAALDMDGRNLNFDMYLTGKKMKNSQIDWLIGKWMNYADLPVDDVEVITPKISERSGLMYKKIRGRFASIKSLADDRLSVQLPGKLSEISPIYQVSSIHEHCISV